MSYTLRIIIGCAVLLILASAEVNYCDYKTLDNPQGFGRVAFTKDEKYMILYERSSKIATVYNLIDWTQVSDPKLTNFAEPP
jgi:hypothetical protein